MSQQSIHDRIMSRSGEEQPSAEPLEAPKGQSNRLKSAGLILLGAAVAGVAVYVATNFDQVSNLVSQPAVAETSQPEAKLADTPFLEHAKKAGLDACSTVFPALGELLTNGSQYSVQSSWNTDKPDEHAVQAFVGMDYATPNYQGSAAGIVYAAPTGSACEGAMIRVAPFPTSCGEIPAMFPQGSKLANNLGNVAVYSLGNNGGNALLLPTGNSCVVVSVASAAK